MEKYKAISVFEYKPGATDVVLDRQAPLDSNMTILINGEKRTYLGIPTGPPESYGKAFMGSGKVMDGDTVEIVN